MYRQLFHAFASPSWGLNHTEGPWLSNYSVLDITYYLPTYHLPTQLYHISTQFQDTTPTSHSSRTEEEEEECANTQQPTTPPADTPPSSCTSSAGVSCTSSTASTTLFSARLTTSLLIRRIVSPGWVWMLWVLGWGMGVLFVGDLILF